MMKPFIPAQFIMKEMQCKTWGFYIVFLDKGIDETYSVNTLAHLK